MLSISPQDYTMQAIRAQGAGGQNVNKVSSAIHLRFDIQASALPEPVKQRLLQSKDKRVTSEGVLVIKAQQFRTQEANKKEAVARLHAIVDAATKVNPTRYATKPTYGARQRRLDKKTQIGQKKRLRGKITPDSI